MAHILLGWGLGGNRSYATTLLTIARALAPDFQGRHRQPMEEDVADAAEQLLQGATAG